MIDSLRAHAADAARAARGSNVLHLAFDLDMRVVVDALADAIERDKRHVRLPRRDALFPMITEVPRRLTEFLLAGVR